MKGAPWAESGKRLVRHLPGTVNTFQKFLLRDSLKTIHSWLVA
ncbi:protein of unknown function [Ralstonia solanacearum CFBP2957]|nr:protein of unknown function [Ralstonia solanacearum CFBP2957]